MNGPSNRTSTLDSSLPSSVDSGNLGSLESDKTDQHPKVSGKSPRLGSSSVDDRRLLQTKSRLEIDPSLQTVPDKASRGLGSPSHDLQPRGKVPLQVSSRVAPPRVDELHRKTIRGPKIEVLAKAIADAFSDNFQSNMGQRVMTSPEDDRKIKLALDDLTSTEFLKGAFAEDQLAELQDEIVDRVHDLLAKREQAVSGLGRTPDKRLLKQMLFGELGNLFSIKFDTGKERGPQFRRDLTTGQSRKDIRTAFTSSAAMIVQESTKTDQAHSTFQMMDDKLDDRVRGLFNALRSFVDKTKQKDSKKPVAGRVQLLHEVKGLLNKGFNPVTGGIGRFPKEGMDPDLKAKFLGWTFKRFNPNQDLSGNQEALGILDQQLSYFTDPEVLDRYLDEAKDPHIRDNLAIQMHGTVGQIFNDILFNNDLPLEDRTALFQELQAHGLIPEDVTLDGLSRLQGSLRGSPLMMELTTHDLTAQVATKTLEPIKGQLGDDYAVGLDVLTSGLMRSGISEQASVVGRRGRLKGADEAFGLAFNKRDKALEKTVTNMPDGRIDQEAQDLAGDLAPDPKQGEEFTRKLSKGEVGRHFFRPNTVLRDDTVPLSLKELADPDCDREAWEIFSHAAAQDELACKREIHDLYQEQAELKEVYRELREVGPKYLKERHKGLLTKLLHIWGEDDKRSLVFGDVHRLEQQYNANRERLRELVGSEVIKNDRLDSQVQKVPLFRTVDGKLKVAFVDPKSLDDQGHLPPDQERKLSFTSYGGRLAVANKLKVHFQNLGKPEGEVHFDYFGLGSRSTYQSHKQKLEETDFTQLEVRDDQGRQQKLGELASEKSIANLLHSLNQRTICGISGTTTDIGLALVAEYGEEKVKAWSGALLEYDAVLKAQEQWDSELKAAKENRGPLPSGPRPRLPQLPPEFKAFFSSVSLFMQAGQYHTPGEVLGGMLVVAAAIEDPELASNARGIQDSYRRLLIHLRDAPEDFYIIDDEAREHFRDNVHQKSEELLAIHQLKIRELSNQNGVRFWKGTDYMPDHTKSPGFFDTDSLMSPPSLAGRQLTHLNSSQREVVSGAEKSGRKYWAPLSPKSGSRGFFDDSSLSSRPREMNEKELVTAYRKFQKLDDEALLKLYAEASGRSEPKLRKLTQPEMELAWEQYKKETIRELEKGDHQSRIEDLRKWRVDRAKVAPKKSDLPYEQDFVRQRRPEFNKAKTWDRMLSPSKVTDTPPEVDRAERLLQLQETTDWGSVPKLHYNQGWKKETEAARRKVATEHERKILIATQLRKWESPLKDLIDIPKNLLGLPESSWEFEHHQGWLARTQDDSIGDAPKWMEVMDNLTDAVGIVKYSLGLVKAKHKKDSLVGDLEKAEAALSDYRNLEKSVPEMERDQQARRLELNILKTRLEKAALPMEDPEALLKSHDQAKLRQEQLREQLATEEHELEKLNGTISRAGERGWGGQGEAWRLDYLLGDTKTGLRKDGEPALYTQQATLRENIRKLKTEIEVAGQEIQQSAETYEKNVQLAKDYVRLQSEYKVALEDFSKQETDLAHLKATLDKASASAEVLEHDIKQLRYKVDENSWKLYLRYPAGIGDAAAGLAQSAAPSVVGGVWALASTGGSVTYATASTAVRSSTFVSSVLPWVGKIFGLFGLISAIASGIRVVKYTFEIRELKKELVKAEAALTEQEGILKDQLKAQGLKEGTPEFVKALEGAKRKSRVMALLDAEKAGLQERITDVKWDWAGELASMVSGLISFTCTILWIAAAAAGIAAMLSPIGIAVGALGSIFLFGIALHKYRRGVNRQNAMEQRQVGFHDLQNLKDRKGDMRQLMAQNQQVRKAAAAVYDRLYGGKVEGYPARSTGSAIADKFGSFKLDGPREALAADPEFQQAVLDELSFKLSRYYVNVTGQQVYRDLMSEFHDLEQFMTHPTTLQSHPVNGGVFPPPSMDLKGNQQTEYLEQAIRMYERGGPTKRNFAQDFPTLSSLRSHLSPYELSQVMYSGSDKDGMRVLLKKLNLHEVAVDNYTLESFDQTPRSERDAPLERGLQSATVGLHATKYESGMAAVGLALCRHAGSLLPKIREQGHPQLAAQLQELATKGMVTRSEAVQLYQQMCDVAGLEFDDPQVRNPDVVLNALLQKLGIEDRHERVSLDFWGGDRSGGDTARAIGKTALQGLSVFGKVITLGHSPIPDDATIHIGQIARNKLGTGGRAASSQPYFVSFERYQSDGITRDERPVDPLQSFEVELEGNRGKVTYRPDLITCDRGPRKDKTDHVTYQRIGEQWFMNRHGKSMMVDLDPDVIETKRKEDNPNLLERHLYNQIYNDLVFHSVMVGYANETAGVPNVEPVRTERSKSLGSQPESELGRPTWFSGNPSLAKPKPPSHSLDSEPRTPGSNGQKLGQPSLAHQQFQKAISDEPQQVKRGRLLFNQGSELSKREFPLAKTPASGLLTAPEVQNVRLQWEAAVRKIGELDGKVREAEPPLGEEQAREEKELLLAYGTLQAIEDLSRNLVSEKFERDVTEMRSLLREELRRSPTHLRPLYAEAARALDLAAPLYSPEQLDGYLRRWNEAERKAPRIRGPELDTIATEIVSLAPDVHELEERVPVGRRLLTNSGNDCFVNVALQAAAGIVGPMGETDPRRVVYPHFAGFLDGTVTTHGGCRNLRKEVATDMDQDPTIVQQLSTGSATAQNDAAEVLGPMLGKLGVRKVQFEKTYTDDKTGITTRRPSEDHQIWTLSLQNGPLKSMAVPTMQEIVTHNLSSKVEDRDNRQNLRASGVDRLAIHGEAPPTLSVQLARYAVDDRSGKVTKDRSSVAGMFDPVKLPLTGDRGEATYTPRSIICHLGTDRKHGHYIIYEKRGDDWFKLNDSVETKVDFSNPEDYENIIQNAYVVNYGKQD